MASVRGIANANWFPRTFNKTLSILFSVSSFSVYLPVAVADFPLRTSCWSRRRFYMPSSNTRGDVKFSPKITLRGTGNRLLKSGVRGAERLLSLISINKTSFATKTVLDLFLLNSDESSFWNALYTSETQREEGWVKRSSAACLRI